MKRKTYLMTVRYGKERFAELEIGDSIFPYDSGVVIDHPGINGILLVHTTLSFDELINYLLKYPPTTLERVVPIIKCVPCSINDVVSTIKSLKLEFNNIVFGRRGCLGRNGCKALAKALLSLKGGGVNTLIIEPLKDRVCIGLVKDRDDKLFKRLRDKLYQE